MGKKINLDAIRETKNSNKHQNLNHLRNRKRFYDYDDDEKNEEENDEDTFLNDEDDDEQDYEESTEEDDDISNDNSQKESQSSNRISLQQTAKGIIKDEAKNAAKKEAKKAVKKTAIKVAIKLIPPHIKAIILGVAAAIILLIIILMAIFGCLGGDPEELEDESGSGGSGLNNYSYHAGACDKVRVKGGDLISMEEYVAGVIAVEVPGFTDEILKTFAIGARTYVIQGASKVGDDDDCYYDVTNTSASFQAYKSGTVDEQYKNAANATRGLIVTLDGKPKMYYDASCVYTASQARSKTPSETFDDNYVYIRYGEKTISGDNYQKIDKEKVKSIGTLNNYINKAENGTACSGNHGWGMSQNGSAYLEATEGYNYEKIINYYYQNKEKLVSIYKGTAGYSGNYPIEPNNELYSNNKFLINKTLSDVLSDNGSSVEEFNGFLKSEVEKAGIGTRNAVIAAAVNLIGSLAEKGYKLNYQWGGKYQAIGIKPDWGTHIKNSYCDVSYKSINSDISVCHTNYSWTSFDCSGFVTWAIINGMQGTNSTGGIQVNQSNIFNSKATSLNPNKAVCKVGGVLQSSGHIVLVVGHDDANKRYIVAESTGSRINTGYGGVKLSYYPYGKEGYWCSNLDDIYGD